MAGAHLLAVDASKMTTPYATIPQETKIIVADAFTGCGTITELVLPVVIDSIDATAFDGLTGLQTIYYYGQNVNAWNKLPADARADLASAKVLYRSTTAPKCPDCAGKGVVSCGVCGETVNAECTECKGEGTVSCTTCGGSGAHHDVAGFWHMVSKVPTVWSN